MQALTSVVCSHGGADFTSISEAIKSAGPGDILVLKAGQYDERVVVDKPVTIKGEHSQDRKAVIIAGGFVSSSDNGVISDVTIQQGVDVRQGACRIENCDIEHGDGVKVGQNAQLSLVKCTVTGANQLGDGVYFMEGSKGVVSECVIANNRVNGIHVKGAEVDVLRNVIKGCRYGIYYRKGAKGTCEGNTIAEMSNHGIYATLGSAPTVVRNEISTCVIQGIIVGSATGGTYRENKVAGNVHIQAGATALCEASDQVQQPSDSAGISLAVKLGTIFSESGIEQDWKLQKLHADVLEALLTADDEDEFVFSHDGRRSHRESQQQQQQQQQEFEEGILPLTNNAIANVSATSTSASMMQNNRPFSSPVYRKSGYAGQESAQGSPPAPPTSSASRRGAVTSSSQTIAPANSVTAPPSTTTSTTTTTTTPPSTSPFRGANYNNSTNDKVVLSKQHSQNQFSASAFDSLPDGLTAEGIETHNLLLRNLLHQQAKKFQSERMQLMRENAILRSQALTLSRGVLQSSDGVNLPPLPPPPAPPPRQMVTGSNNNYNYYGNSNSSTASKVIDEMDLLEQAVINEESLIKEVEKHRETNHEFKRRLGSEAKRRSHEVGELSRRLAQVQRARTAERDELVQKLGEARKTLDVAAKREGLFARDNNRLKDDVSTLQASVEKHKVVSVALESQLHRARADIDALVESSNKQLALHQEQIVALKQEARAHTRQLEKKCGELARRGIDMARRLELSEQHSQQLSLQRKQSASSSLLMRKNSMAAMKLAKNGGGDDDDDNGDGPPGKDQAEGGAADDDDSNALSPGRRFPARGGDHLQAQKVTKLEQTLSEKQQELDAAKDKLEELELELSEARSDVTNQILMKETEKQMQFERDRMQKALAEMQRTERELRDALKSTLQNVDNGAKKATLETGPQTSAASALSPPSAKRQNNSSRSTDNVEFLPKSVRDVIDHKPSWMVDDEDDDKEHDDDDAEHGKAIRHAHADDYQQDHAVDFSAASMIDYVTNVVHKSKAIQTDAVKFAAERTGSGKRAGSNRATSAIRRSATATPTPTTTAPTTSSPSSRPRSATASSSDQPNHEKLRSFLAGTDAQEQIKTKKQQQGQGQGQGQGKNDEEAKEAGAAAQGKKILNKVPEETSVAKDEKQKIQTSSPTPLVSRQSRTVEAQTDSVVPLLRLHEQQQQDEAGAAAMTVVKSPKTAVTAAVDVMIQTSPRLERVSGENRVRTQEVGHGVGTPTSSCSDHMLLIQHPRQSVHSSSSSSARTDGSDSNDDEGEIRASACVLAAEVKESKGEPSTMEKKSKKEVVHTVDVGCNPIPELLNRSARRNREWNDADDVNFTMDTATTVGARGHQREHQQQLNKLPASIHDQSVQTDPMIFHRQLSERGSTTSSRLVMNYNNKLVLHAQNLQQPASHTFVATSHESRAVNSDVHLCDNTENSATQLRQKSFPSKREWQSIRTKEVALEISGTSAPLSNTMNELQEESSLLLLNSLFHGKQEDYNRPVGTASLGVAVVAAAVPNLNSVRRGAHFNTSSPRRDGQREHWHYSASSKASRNRLDDDERGMTNDREQETQTKKFPMLVLDAIERHTLQGQGYQDSSEHVEAAISRSLRRGHSSTPTTPTNARGRVHESIKSNSPAASRSRNTTPSRGRFPTPLHPPPPSASQHLLARLASANTSASFVEATPEFVVLSQEQQNSERVESHQHEALRQQQRVRALAKRRPAVRKIAVTAASDQPPHQQQDLKGKKSSPLRTAAAEQQHREGEEQDLSALSTVPGQKLFWSTMECTNNINNSNNTSSFFSSPTKRTSERRPASSILNARQRQQQYSSAGELDSTRQHHELVARIVASSQERERCLGQIQEDEPSLTSAVTDQPLHHKSIASVVQQWDIPSSVVTTKGKDDDDLQVRYHTPSSAHVRSLKQRRAMTAAVAVVAGTSSSASSSSSPPPILPILPVPSSVCKKGSATTNSQHHQKSARLQLDAEDTTQLLQRQLGAAVFAAPLSNQPQQQQHGQVTDDDLDISEIVYFPGPSSQRRHQRQQGAAGVRGLLTLAQRTSPTRAPRDRQEQQKDLGDTSTSPSSNSRSAARAAATTADDPSDPYFQLRLEREQREREDSERTRTALNVLQPLHDDIDARETLRAAAIANTSAAMPLSRKEMNALATVEKAARNRKVAQFVTTFDPVLFRPQKKISSSLQNQGGSISSKTL